MKAAVVGASGRAGSCIVAELARRGHQVTGIARHADRIPALAGVTAQQGDAGDYAALAKRLAGHDAVVSAVRFADSDPDTLIAAVRASGVKRYLVVGGAASLEVAPGRKLFDTPQFPAAYKTEAGAGIKFLEKLSGADDLEWTFFSPAAIIEPGERTGKFRLGGEQLVVGENGSRISFEDYAVAAVDELERPSHVRRRFTIGY